eukprot:NODE_1165_length_973_cov_264.501082_g971_i0.p1 GENE.NODE_1165_length_973_cov_264.501082_g971_i0~~NODE_1165_length_973_cov_264.501082_g971_i0.p1  ORF type:complete len:260 (-),score=28.94 NODE_1165_length_973_cov_264.501082_g971_i0:113-892(-)
MTSRSQQAAVLAQQEKDEVRNAERFDKALEKLLARRHITAQEKSRGRGNMSPRGERSSSAATSGLQRSHSFARKARTDVLDLSRCSLTADRLDQLAKAISGDDSVRVLQLGANYIGNAAFTHVCDIVANPSSITGLDLHLNSLNEIGAAKLAAALAKNTVLQRLDLSTNHLGDSGAITLADALKDGSSLTDISLQNNDIADSGVQALAAAVAANASVVNVNVGNNPYASDRARAALATAVLHNQRRAVDQQLARLQAGA